MAAEIGNDQNLKCDGRRPDSGLLLGENLMRQRRRGELSVTGD